MTVAALDVNAPYPREPYSSEGPTNGPGGTEAGGFAKPDISAYANVSTEAYAPNKFKGTSAATPHVAGAAALVLSAHPDYTPAQIQDFLEKAAFDMGVAGKDTVYGHGRLFLDSGSQPVDGGYDLGFNLWSMAVLKPTWMGPVTLRWHKGGQSVSPTGDTTIWGYFYASPGDFPFGSPDNPEVFVKVYIAANGWTNIAFNHVTVDDVDVFSARNYMGNPDQTSTIALTNRLAEHTYE